MFSFLLGNLGTLAAGLTVAGIAVLIIRSIIREKRKGKCAGCGCMGCGDSAKCTADNSHMQV